MGRQRKAGAVPHHRRRRSCRIGSDRIKARVGTAALACLKPEASMSHIDQLVEQHIRESESHLRHIDEMIEKARKARERSELGAASWAQSLI